MTAIGAQELDRELTNAFNLFYNLEFDEALKRFTILSQQRPREADVQNGLAQALLFRTMLRTGFLESSVVSNNKALLGRGKMPFAPEDEKRFAAAIDRALELSQKEDPGSLYSLGVACGFRVTFDFLVKRAAIDALRDLSRARRAHNRAFELDPQFFDAQMVQGLYDYVLGSLPWYYRTLGFLGGFHGDRPRGLAIIESVAAKGKRNKTDAAIILAGLYRREKRNDDAYRILDSLVKSYPGNVLYSLELAGLQVEMKQFSQARARLKEVLRDPRIAGTPYEATAKALTGKLPIVF